MKTSPQYHAFISYSHSDERWARWLHRSLERYRVPRRLVGRETPTGRVPRSLFPIFRDREELASAHELGGQIEQALAQSRHLIVLCSPAAARSRWVNEEVLRFKRLGRAEQIVCLILDGEPGDPERECFPPALRFQVNEQGELTNTAAEPMAADVRPQGDGPSDARLKLIAGLLGVGFNALKQRELAARNRRLSVLAGIASLVAIVTIGLAVLAVQARDAAEHQRQVAVQAREQAEAARKEAEKRQAESEQTADFLVDLLASANPYENDPDLKVRSLLDQGAARIEAELANQPQVLARLLFALGRSYWSLSLWDEGESRMKRGLELLHSSGAPLAEIADAQEKLARSLVYRERYADAERYLRDALATLKHDKSTTTPQRAVILVELAKLIGQRDRSSQPEEFEMLEEARAILEQLGQTQGWTYAHLLGNLGNLHKLQYAWDEALPLLVTSSTVALASADAPAISAAYVVENLGRMYYFMGDYLQARPTFEEALRKIAAQVGEAAMELDWSLYYLARIEREQGLRAQARKHLLRVVQHETASPQTPDERYLGRALCGLAILDIEEGFLDSARRQADRCRSILDAATGQTRVQHNVVHEAFTMLALAEGQVEVALMEARAHVEVLERGHDPAQTDLVLAHGMLGAALAQAGQMQAAQAAFADAESFARRHYPPDYPTLGRVYWARSALLAQQGESAAAERDRQRALDIMAGQRMQPQDTAWRIQESPAN